MGRLLRLLPLLSGALPHAAHAQESSSSGIALAAAAAESGFGLPWWVWAAIGFLLLVGLGFWMAGWGSDPSEETYG